jgi:hypothetical protein
MAITSHISLEGFGGYNVVDFQVMRNTIERAKLNQAEHAIRKSLGQNTGKINLLPALSSRG